ncbi:MAG: flagellar motor switch protein FliN [Stellaceae bacterium]
MADDPGPGAAPPPTGDGGAPPGETGADSPFAALEMQAEAIAGVPVGASGALDLVLDVPVRLSVELGRTDIVIREVVNLGRGSIIELDRGPGMPLDVRINGVLIGRGEVVLVNQDRLGLRFVEVVSQAERVKRLG